jgi:uncharacterized protein CbrC (UPF0167 family)
MDLPLFKYHPDPVATGSVEIRNARCACCGEDREAVYVGSVYAEANLDESICPWCIGSGLAHERFEAEFTDRAAVGGDDLDSRNPVPQEVTEEVAYRTPGFSGWQQERWLVHCGDACAFLGPAGKRELGAYGSEDLLESIRADAEMDESEFQDYLDALDRDSGPTAYVFRCLHCGRHLGYSDFT